MLFFDGFIYIQVADDLDAASYAGDEDSAASVAVVSLAERQSRAAAGRETLERRLSECIFCFSFFLLSSLVVL